MDYEKAYKEAIKRAKAMIEVAEKEEEVYKSAITIFPELAESEDERIRKVLIDLVKCNERSGYTLLNNVTTDSILAWLEKQGKHKDYYTKQELIDMGFSFTLNGDIVTPDKMMEDMKKYLAWLEKQCEQKPKWTEEDSLMIDSIIDTMKWLEGKGATNMKIDWLKSLKKRMGT